MFKTHTIGKRTVYEYLLVAFQTQKGTFTLVGTETKKFEVEKHVTSTIDTFKNLNTGEFHEWPRSSIKKWLDQGKLTPIPEATELLWWKNQNRPSKGRPQSKVIRK